MTQFLKITILASLSLSFSLFAAQPPQKIDCQRVADTAQTYCDGLTEYYCKDIGECLVRRDTCLSDGKVPNDKESCEEYDQCLDGMKSKFNSVCRFKWAPDSLTEKVRCVDERSSWWRSTSCPGYTKGDLLRAFIVDEKKERDVKFDCSLTRDEYGKMQTKCNEAIANYEKNCLIGPEDKAKVSLYKKNTKCEDYENFDKYKRGQFAIDTQNRRVIDSSRQKKAPLEDGASGSSSGKKGGSTGK